MNLNELNILSNIDFFVLFCILFIRTTFSEIKRFTTTKCCTSPSDLTQPAVMATPHSDWLSTLYEIAERVNYNFVLSIVLALR